MFFRSRTTSILKSIIDIGTSDVGRQKVVSSNGLDPRMKVLLEFQVNRLKETYADLLEDAETYEVMSFFLDEIYAPKDFAQRDHDAEHLYAQFKNALSPEPLQLLEDVIQVNKQSQALDQLLADVLGDRLQPDTALQEEDYIAGYRECDNADDRMAHLELTVSAMRDVVLGSHSRAVGLGLRMIKIPAYSAGYGDLYEFLQRGYRACKPLRNVDRIVDTIFQRESQVIENIFNGVDEPFRLDA